jgi:protein SCO1/2
MGPLRTGIVIALMLSAACSRPAAREYHLRGQVIAIDAARQEVTITHEDIPGFMPGMTMPFKVADRALLEGRVPGDLVTATLVLRDTDASLTRLERVGSAPLPVTAAPVAPRLAVGEVVEDGQFVDEQGRPRRLSDWRGNAIAVTFMYTRCPLPNFCPLMDRQFKAVQDLVRKDAGLNGHVRLLSVSFDPEHDTPEVLAGHAAALGANPDVWRFVTGTPADVDRFGAQFGISVMRDDPREIVHNLRTAVIDGERRLVAVFNGGDWTPAELVKELRSARAGR